MSTEPEFHNFAAAALGPIDLEARKPLVLDNDARVDWTIRLFLELDAERTRVSEMALLRDRDLLHQLNYLASRFAPDLARFLERALARTGARRARHVKMMSGILGFRVVGPEREVLYVKAPKGEKELNLTALIVNGMPGLPSGPAAAL